MTQVNQSKLEVGKKYLIKYPWIAGYTNEGVLVAIRDLTHAKDDLHYEGEPYKQFVFCSEKYAKSKKRKLFAENGSVMGIGDILTYSDPMLVGPAKGKFNEYFEIVSK